ncbi:hypothetical protein CEXT_171881 [Caerostris extrusa]|uniref:Uncharacterized protein n=1 Tax=Caerostris extrusa TaxID=172846 RepID=A0AAV4V4Y7_CAEEX|nr:hypothetical protein CEXT_171881 [Caerostris extrusa]
MTRRRPGRQTKAPPPSHAVLCSRKPSLARMTKEHLHAQYHPDKPLSPQLRSEEVYVLKSSENLFRSEALRIKTFDKKKMKAFPLANKCRDTFRLLHYLKPLLILFSPAVIRDDDDQKDYKVHSELQYSEYSFLCGNRKLGHARSLANVRRSMDLCANLAAFVEGKFPPVC